MPVLIWIWLIIAILKIAFIFYDCCYQKRVNLILLAISDNILLIIPHIDIAHLNIITIPNTPATPSKAQKNK